MKYNLTCDWCDKPIQRYKKSNHNFCCRQCLADFSNKSKNPNGYADLKDYTNMSKHLTELNIELNPSRMTDAIRKKIHDTKSNADSEGYYKKYYGRHEHRVVAERILQRPLLPGEVVHHRDGNKSNNAEENLVIFNNQSEHARHHAELNWFIHELEEMEGGDAK